MADHDAIAAQPFRLLDLPLELRLMIYEFLPVAHVNRKISSAPTLKVIWLPTTILRTCQSVKNEAASICRATTKRYDKQMSTNDNYEWLRYIPRIVVTIDLARFPDVARCLDVVPEILDYALTWDSDKRPSPQITEYCENTGYALEWTRQANQSLNKASQDKPRQIDLAVEIHANTRADLDLYKSQCDRGLWMEYGQKMEAVFERNGRLCIDFLYALPQTTDPRSPWVDIEKLFDEQSIKEDVFCTYPMGHEEWKLLWVERDWL